MSEEPENLMLHLLRGLRSDVAKLRAERSSADEVLHEVRRTVTSHNFRFDALDERVEMLREGTLTAIGFAAHATQSQKKLQDQIADRTRRVENLEKAQ
ncbi:MAG: hypothetical protein ACLPN5_16470 [Roseiarcus sp.]